MILLIIMWFEDLKGGWATLRLLLAATPIFRLNLKIAIVAVRMAPSQPMRGSREAAMASLYPLTIAPHFVPSSRFQEVSSIPLFIIMPHSLQSALQSTARKN